MPSESATKRATSGTRKRLKRTRCFDAVCGLARSAHSNSRQAVRVIGSLHRSQRVYTQARSYGYIQISALFPYRPPARSQLNPVGGERHAGLLEGLIAGLRQTWGDQIPIDLVTCYASLPKGFEPHNTRVYRVGDYRGRAARAGLYRELAGNHYGLVGIICSGEIVMAKWKWVLALRISGQAFYH